MPEETAHDYPMYIAGRPVPADDGATFASYDPATGQRFASLAKAGPKDVDRAVRAARHAFDQGPWPRMTGAERAAVLTAAAERLEAEASNLAGLEVRDSGATIRKARLIDVPGARAALEWSAWWARELPAVEPDRAPAPGEYLRWHPAGVVAAFVPWNFPLLLAAWRIAPAIAAGNTCVIKPASFTSVTACRFVRVLHEAGVPAGVVNLVLGQGTTIGEELTRHPGVDMVAFTGSNEVGERVRDVTAAAGKQVKLDLGGKSASVVLEDADLELAVAGVLGGIYVHNGQICMAGSRALVHHRRYADFLELFRERAGKLVLGDPGRAETDLGPLVSRQQARTVARYVSLGRAQGAALVCGGSRPEPGELAPGLDVKAYFRPTALAGVERDNVVFREEIFGPVLAVTPFDSDEQAVALANDSRYRLAGAVWSADLDHAWRVADQVRAERVWVNDYQMFDLTTPDPACPAALTDRVRNDLDDYRVLRRMSVTAAGRPDQLWGVLGPGR
jgi:acyl-CoA reductase-like NAD-dependent aldehyde dehydrogenase